MLSALRNHRRRVILAAMAASMFVVSAMPAYAQDATPSPGSSIENAATGAATAGIAAGAAVAVIVLGGTVVYKLVKKFTS